MNQKGFATILSLCLILAIALVVKGIQESETNHAYESANFQAEFDLQNAAESVVVEAADKVLSGEIILPVNKNPYAVNSRQKYQIQIISTTKNSAHIGTITAEAWGERINLQPYKVSYSDTKNTASKDGDAKEAYFFFSRVSANGHAGKKIYRRATAYIFADGDTTIKFMEVPMSSYTFQN